MEQAPGASEPGFTAVPPPRRERSHRSPGPPAFPTLSGSVGIRHVGPVPSGAGVRVEAGEAAAVPIPGWGPCAAGGGLKGDALCAAVSRPPPRRPRSPPQAGGAPPGAGLRSLGDPVPQGLGLQAVGREAPGLIPPDPTCTGAAPWEPGGPQTGAKAPRVSAPPAPEGNSCLGSLFPPSSLPGGTLRNEPRNSKCVIPQFKTLIFVFNTGISQYKDEG